jgi:hypothetical protein
VSDQPSGLLRFTARQADGRFPRQLATLTFASSAGCVQVKAVAVTPAI